VISDYRLNRYAKDIEKAHFNFKDVAKMVRTGALPPFEYLGEGESRITIGNGKEAIKVAISKLGAAQNTIESVILSELDDPRIKRHVPNFYGISENKYCLHVEQIKGPIADFKLFFNHDDFWGFRELVIDQDLDEDNVLWCAKRNTWVAVDLGCCWQTKNLDEMVRLLRAGESLDDFAI